MAYALVGTIGVVTTATGSLTPAWGTGESRTAGNLLIAFASVPGQALFQTTPSGWSIASQITGTSCSAQIFYKIAAGGDAAPTFASAPNPTSIQLAEFSGGATSSPLDKTGTATGTSSPITATFGAADTASGELIVMSSADFRSASRAPNDTWTSNHAAVTQAGNNNGASIASHYSFGYGLTTSNSGADTAVMTASVTTSITGLAVVAATFKLAPQVFTQSFTPTLSHTAALNKRITDGGFVANLSFVGAFATARKYFQAFTATLFSEYINIIDSYSESNYANQTFTISAGLTSQAAAQSFTGNGSILTSSAFYLRTSIQVPPPPGTVTSTLYAHTGTFGTSSKPTGAALAVSEPLLASSITSTQRLYVFHFLTPFTLVNGTNYCISVEYNFGDASTYLLVGRDTTSPTHAGNPSTLAGSTWSLQTTDLIFYCNSTPLLASLTKTTLKLLTGALSFIGDFVTNYIPAAGGTLFTQSVSGSLSFVGAIGKLPNKNFSPVFSPIAALTRSIAKSLTATLTSTAALTRKYLDAGFTATLSFVGNLAASKTFLRALTAAISFTGALSRRTGKTLNATLSFVGAITKSSTRRLTATLSFIGSLAISKLFVRAFTATLNFTGALSRKTLKALSATLSFIGNLAESFIAGGGHVFTQAFSATLSFTGTFSRFAQKAFSATLNWSASFVRRTTHAFSSTLSSAGALVKVIKDAGFTATLSFVGNLATATVHFFTRSFTATLSFIGAISTSRRFARALAATLNMTGQFRRSVGKSLAATLSFSVAFRKAIRKVLAAVLSFAVFFFKGGAVEIIAGLVTKCGALIGIGGSTARIAKAGSQLDVVERGSGAKIQVAGSTLRVERTN